MLGRATALARAPRPPPHASTGETPRACMPHSRVIGAHGASGERAARAARVARARAGAPARRAQRGRREHPRAAPARAARARLARAARAQLARPNQQRGQREREKRGRLGRRGESSLSAHSTKVSVRPDNHKKKAGNARGALGVGARTACAAQRARQRSSVRCAQPRDEHELKDLGRAVLVTSPPRPAQRPSRGDGGGEGGGGGGGRGG